MADRRNTEVSCSSINLVAPQGFMSVQITVRFSLGTDSRYTVASFDIPVPLGEDTTVYEAKNTALALVKSYLCPELAKDLPSTLND